MGAAFLLLAGDAFLFVVFEFFEAEGAFAFGAFIGGAFGAVLVKTGIRKTWNTNGISGCIILLEITWLALFTEVLVLALGT